LTTQYFLNLKKEESESSYDPDKLTATINKFLEKKSLQSKNQFPSGENMPKLDENNQLINQKEDNLFWSKIANVNFFILYFT
jgi:hypothetical protein